MAKIAQVVDLNGQATEPQNRLFNRKTGYNLPGCIETKKGASECIRLAESANMAKPMDDLVISDAATTKKGGWDNQSNSTNRYGGGKL
jgi:hypothetical protein